MKRCDVYAHQKKCDPDWKAGQSALGPDYVAFHPPAIDAEPWTLAEFEEFERTNEIPPRILAMIAEREDASALPGAETRQLCPAPSP